MIGLGNAGLALASPILRSFALVGFDRDPVRCGLADRAGVEVVSSPQAVAARCEILILLLPRPDISRSVLSTIAPSALQGRIVVETSTVAPDDIDRLVDMVAPAGGSVVDSAIVGGVAKLTKGETTFLVGASEPDFARVKPVLKAAAETIFHLDKVGNGMRAKVVNNAESLGHLDWLAVRCRARGIATVAVGDGGNEIGFGAVRAQLAVDHPYGSQCGCPCGAGIIDNTTVDVLFPAAVSNWGGYALAAAVCMAVRQYDLLPGVDEMEASVRAPLAHGAFDGYSGLSVPTVDGTSLAVNKAIYQLVLEVVRLAQTE